LNQRIEQDNRRGKENTMFGNHEWEYSRLASRLMVTALGGILGGRLFYSFE
jgi:hypothetical protein